VRVGVGLPNTVAGADGDLMIEWARRADSGPFSSLGVFDRVAYDSYDPLTVLAAAAAVTRRVRLVTTVLVGPLYNTVLLAKAAASVDRLSNGRLVLGLAVGARAGDYQAAGVDYRSRGRRLSDQLAAFRLQWEDECIGPKPSRPRGPELLLGGQSDQVFVRVARYGDGYIHGGGPPRTFARAADRTRAAWVDSGRPGRPLLWAQGYYALGDDAAEAGRRYLLDYYAFTGPFAERIATGLLATPQAIVQFTRGYEDAGCDEMVLFPTTADIAQLDRLAEIMKP
jgi:alkanesulfonate monooxygenase SsuD/methylene tetrahydromethanopterin reductase-like flavin-dependent oxidoreductase (luciferase family)